MNMMGNTARTLSSQQARFLSEVEIVIGVEVGKITMSAAQLLDLLPGQTFEFAFAENQLMTLLVADEKIAEARFVVKDESMALEVTAVNLDYCQNNDKLVNGQA